MSDFESSLDSLKRKQASLPPGPRPMTDEERRRAVRDLRVKHGLAVPTFEDTLRLRRIPRRFWELVKDPKETLALTYAKALLEGKGVLLLLHGDKGCGKSTAAAWALSQHTGMWVDAPDLERPPMDDEDASDRELATTPLLVIDDLGTEYSTEKKYSERRITVAISKREASLLPTIITANLSPEEFKARYGDRTSSRINGDPLGWQTVTAPDMRMERHISQPFNERGEK